MNFEQLEQLVIAWANDRNIINGSDAVAQLAVTIEECSELLKALNAGDMDEAHDAYGDILVTLIIGAAITFPGTPLTTHLEGAYHVIKDRKGRMVNGKFTKTVE